MGRWHLAILLYLIIICLLLAVRPSMMFVGKQYKTFGISNSENQSIFSIMVIFPVIAFLSYFLSAWYILIIT